MELAPWSAFLMLLQLFIGERVDAARQCSWQRISGHDPSCGVTPMIRVPRINGKTTPRDITLFPPFAHPLWEWSTGKPLVAKTGEQWPATGTKHRAKHATISWLLCRWAEEMLEFYVSMTSGWFSVWKLH